MAEGNRLWKYSMCCVIDLTNDFDLLCRDLLLKPMKKYELLVNSLKWFALIYVIEIK